MKNHTIKILSVLLSVVILMTCTSACAQWYAFEPSQDTHENERPSTTSTTTTEISTTTSNTTIIDTQTTNRSMDVTTKTSVNKSFSGSHKINVPLIAQKPEFPSGCESVSAVMALRYFGETIRVTDFINKHLSMSFKFYYKDGRRYGPSPYEYFIGNPMTTQSYGCMAPVIEKALVSYLGSDERIYNVTSTDMKDLCINYIDNDLPVLVWVTIAMIDTSTSDSWYLEDGTLFQWPGNEHCMVLVGYDEKYYYFNDPYTGKTVKHAHSLAELRYEQLGKQAIVITN